MENIKHLWNVTNHLAKFDGDTANYFRMYYIQRCKNESEIDLLPKTHFGPSVMCSHCGSLWSKNKPRVKVDPGRSCSKSVKQIIRATEYNSLCKFRASLLKKSLKNKMNKIIIKCPVCTKKTIISSKKPERVKSKPEEAADKSINISTSQKKKKKKKKDKTAGLKILINQSPCVDKKKKVVPVSKSTPVIRIKKKERELTPLQKVRKMNLNKIRMMLNEHESDKSKNSISNFLKELY